MRDVRLRGENGKVVLRVDGYVDPDATSGLHANLLIGAVEADVGTVGSFKAMKTVTLHTEDLRRFRDQLTMVDTELTGEATLTNIDSDFEATFRLERGKGTLSGVILEWARELRFRDIETDQTYVRDALHELDAMVETFPVRGSPFD